MSRKARDRSDANDTSRAGEHGEGNEETARACADTTFPEGREGNRQEGTREGGMHVAAKGQKSRGTRAPAVRNVQLDLEITPSRMHPRSSFLVRNEGPPAKT